MEHLIVSVKGIAGALKDPSVLRQFGSADRPSLSFEVLKERYETGLAAKKAVGMPYQQLNTEGVKSQVLSNFESINHKLLTRAEALSESDFDILQLPHPLLGVLTLREMLFFTAFHTRHHLDIISNIS
ncbi:MAG: DinB family protein [Saprospiraceae bacterium]|nr:DinB family protein [Saprospiraceae bacterium]